MRTAVASLVVAALCASQAHAQTRLVIVSGLGGQPKFAKNFSEWSSALAQAAHERSGLPDSAITWLGDPASPKTNWYRGPSLKDTVEARLARIAERSSPADQLMLVLIGHGSGEQEETRISLPGPDLSAKDFVRILGKFSGRRVALINLTSASGDMAPVLAAPGRVVVTATKSAFERNESHFARFFVAALAKDGADTDKDNRVSLLEAYKYAETETKRLYDDDGRLATEHSQILDQSQLARRFFLTPGAASHGASDARLASLYQERFSLDEQIQALKLRKTQMMVPEYEAELEKLLVTLAQKARDIRRIEKGGA